MLLLTMTMLYLFTFNSVIKWVYSSEPNCNYFHSDCYTAVCATQWDEGPDSKVHGANMGPIWLLSAPDGPHVGPRNLAIRGCSLRYELLSSSDLSIDSLWTTNQPWWAHDILHNMWLSHGNYNRHSYVYLILVHALPFFLVFIHQ